MLSANSSLIKTPYGNNSTKAEAKSVLLIFSSLILCGRILPDDSHCRKVFEAVQFQYRWPDWSRVYHWWDIDKKSTARCSAGKQKISLLYISLYTGFFYFPCIFFLRSYAVPVRTFRYLGVGWIDVFFETRKMRNYFFGISIITNRFITSERILLAIGSLLLPTKQKPPLIQSILSIRTAYVLCIRTKSFFGSFNSNFSKVMASTYFFLLAINVFCSAAYKE